MLAYNVLSYIGYDQLIWSIASTLTFYFGCGNCLGIRFTVDLCRLCGRWRVFDNTHGKNTHGAVVQPLPWHVLQLNRRKGINCDI